MARSFGLPQQRLGGDDSKPASHNSLPALAAKHRGGIRGLDDLPEFAGKNFVYAFMGARVGSVCRQRSPGLKVAINRCENLAGRIIPSTRTEY